jgi:hypothetical protein
MVHVPAAEEEHAATHASFVPDSAVADHLLDPAPWRSRLQARDDQAPQPDRDQIDQQQLVHEHAESPQPVAVWSAGRREGEAR